MDIENSTHFSNTKYILLKLNLILNSFCNTHGDVQLLNKLQNEKTKVRHDACFIELFILLEQKMISFFRQANIHILAVGTGTILLAGLFQFLIFLLP